MQSEKHDGDTFVKLANWPKQMDIQVKSVNFKPLNPISVSCFLHIIATACVRYGSDEGTALWHFQIFRKDRAKASLAHKVCITKEYDSQQKG